MSYLPLLLTFAAVDLLAVVSPGPNFVVVSHAAIQHGRMAAVAVVAGLTIANLVWCLAVLFGMAALFEVAPWLYDGIRFIGGAYLVYFGAQLWRHKAMDQTPTRPLQSRSGRPVVKGVLTGLTNPKSVIYFGSVFTLFMAPGSPGWVQITAVAIVLINAAIWYGAIAMLLSRQGMRRMYDKVGRITNRVAGGFLIVFGFRLLFVQERSG